MIEVLILALALSMDAFAVSVGLGAKHKTKLASLSLTAGLYFGVSQGIMPLIGYFTGQGVLSWVESYAPWIAFILLFLIGGKMIYESFSEGNEQEIVKVTHKVMLTLAIATSIDAMAAGFTLTFLPVDPYVACVVIGVTTFVFSWFGVFIGAKSGTWLESKSELFGGVTLILMALKMIFTKLYG